MTWTRWPEHQKTRHRLSWAGLVPVFRARRVYGSAFVK
jgi:hypothetical protein